MLIFPLLEARGRNRKAESNTEMAAFGLGEQDQLHGQSRFHFTMRKLELVKILSDQYPDRAGTRNRERCVGALESRVLRWYLSPAAPAAGSPPSLAVSLAAPSLAPCLAITQGLIRAIAGNLTHCCSEARTAGAKDYLYWAQIAAREEIAVREELSRTRRHNPHPLEGELITRQWSEAKPVFWGTGWLDV